IRVQRDVLGGSSNIGGIATAVVRQGDADAVTGGVDYNIRWARNLFNWNGTWMATHAPFGAQTRNGFGGVTNLDYIGKHVEFQSNLGHISRGFRITDFGFLTNSRIDKTVVSLTFFLKQPDPW